MKKRLILKIIFSILLIFSIIVLIRLGVYFADLAHFYSDKITPYFTKKDLFEYILYSSTCFLSVILEIIFLIMLIKGIPFLFETTLTEYKNNKATRKQKKIEELEKQLNELKKNMK